MEYVESYDRGTHITSLSYIMEYVESYDSALGRREGGIEMERDEGGKEGGREGGRERERERREGRLNFSLLSSWNM